MGEPLSWDDADVWAGGEPTRRPGQVVDPSWVESSDVVEPGDGWEGWRDVVRYLEALFQPDEVVGYVVDSWLDEDDGRWKPKGGGICSETAGEVAQRVRKHKGELDASLGWGNAEAGAWVRFNPLDGKGVKNENVTEYRYALVESDSVDVGRQMAIVRELNLPVAALVHSGNKSLHAIVRVEAADYSEYKKRVDFLSATCKKNGLPVDTQNKNPSRLSRLPGVVRAGRKQWLVDTDIGASSWVEWREWLAEQEDDLPDPESLADVWDDLPELAPPLIEGVLRQGHKMLLAGPSKAGKSFALIELCVAVAEGGRWFGFQCAQGRVLYVNLELDRASCLTRFKDVIEAMGARPSCVGNVDVWNLRGKSKPMDQLAPSLIRRALKTRPIMVVIDPIYKVITGDENSAEQMAKFCNQFDRVASEIGCAVVYCHHHSKGLQGQKAAMDRASGSGVFSRDPDAMLDMGRLDVDEGTMSAHVLNDGGDAADTAWRIEGTLREFPSFDPVDLWFQYPLHRADRKGQLAELDVEGSARAIERKRDRAKAAAAEKRQEKRKKALEDAIEHANDGMPPTVKQACSYIGELDGKPVTPAALKKWLQQFGYTSNTPGYVIMREVEVAPPGSREG